MLNIIHVYENALVKLTTIIKSNIKTREKTSNKTNSITIKLKYYFGEITALNTAVDWNALAYKE